MAVQMVYTRFQNKEETIKNTCLVSSISIFRGGGGVPVTYDTSYSRFGIHFNA